MASAAATPLASLHMHRSADHVAPHPVTCVECVHTSRGVLVVAAGGSSISAGFDREWFPPQVRAGVGSGLFPSSSSSSASPSTGLAGGAAALGGEKGMRDVHAAVEALLWESGNGGEATATGRVPPLKLPSGHATCLAVRALPGGAGALGVVGTTVGSLLVFVADGETLSVLRAYALQEWSQGMITAQDVVRSVGIGMDPASRLEFIAVSTAHCAVVMDIQSLDDDRAQAHGTQAISVLTGSQSKPRLATLKRARSATCVVPIVHTEVVRVLVPERYNAAFGFDLAVVLVLADTTLRFVERHVRGGSLRLLQDYHARLQKASSSAAYALDSTTATAEDEEQTWQRETALLTDARALPHVVYEYELAVFQFNVSRAGDGARFHERAVTVNDAALSYNARSGRMDVVLVGATQDIAPTTATTTSTSTSATNPAMLSALARRASASGLFATREGGAVLGQTSLTATPRSADAPARLGWWAIARSVVLPQHTTRSVLAKERWYASAAVTDDDDDDAHVSVHSIHVQSSTVRLRRPRAPTSAYPATSSFPSTAPANAGLNGMRGAAGDASAQAETTSPVDSSPPSSGHGAGAQVGSAGAGVDDHRSELSALVVVRANDLALIASGTELYVASLSDAPIAAPTTDTGLSFVTENSVAAAAASTSLSALRHVRSGGTLWEDLACLSTAPAASAATGAQNAILSAGGSSVVLLTV